VHVYSYTLLIFEDLVHSSFPSINGVSIASCSGLLWNNKWSELYI